MAAVKRIDRQNCCGVLIDVQEFFLAQIGERRQAAVRTNTANFARLLGYFKIPLVVTLERPVERKGSLPDEIIASLPAAAVRLEKSFFDLTKEERIAGHLGRLKKNQAIVAGCETDVCVLQSCLGLLSLGYDVFLVEELLFSSAANVEAAIAWMKAEGAVFLSYKSLYYELMASVDDSGYTAEMLQTFGPFPSDLPDVAVE